MYGGAAVTSKNIYRQVGLSTFTEVAGAATFNANPNMQYEVVFGIGATDDDDEPFGCKATWTCPCEAYPTLSAGRLCVLGNRKGVIDDTAAGTSLTSTFFDPDDGNAISATDGVDIDAGQVKNIKWVFNGVFEEAYGNPFITNGNVVTIKFNNTAFDSVKLTNDAGAEFTSTSTPSAYAAAAGHITKSYKVPAVLSNSQVTYYVVVDADDTINPTTANITVYMYDGSWFINNDNTPPTVDSGVEDEDAVEVGGSTAFSGTIYNTAD